MVPSRLRPRVRCAVLERDIFLVELNMHSQRPCNIGLQRRQVCRIDACTTCQSSNDCVAIPHELPRHDLRCGKAHLLELLNQFCTYGALLIRPDNELAERYLVE